MLWGESSKPRSRRYAVLFVVAFPFVMALAKVNGPITRHEEFEAYQRWEAENAQKEKV